MDAAGSESAALLGVSEGGYTTTMFATTHPERTKALVLYGCYARELGTGLSVGPKARGIFCDFCH